MYYEAFENRVHKKISVEGENVEIGSLKLSRFFNSHPRVTQAANEVNRICGDTVNIYLCEKLENMISAEKLIGACQRHNIFLTDMRYAVIDAAYHEAFHFISRNRLSKFEKTQLHQIYLNNSVERLTDYENDEEEVLARAFASFASSMLNRCFFTTFRGSPMEIFFQIFSGAYA